MVIGVPGDDVPLDDGRARKQLLKEKAQGGLVIRVRAEPDVALLGYGSGQEASTAEREAQGLWPNNEGDDVVGPW